MNDPALKIVRAARAGDESAWRELLEMFRLAMQKYVNQAVFVGRDEDDAWSRCHEIVLRCVRTFDENRRLKFGTLLFTALSHVPMEAMQRGPIHVPHSAYRTHPEYDRRAKQVRSLDARNPRTKRTMHDRLGRPDAGYSDLPEIVSAAVSRLKEIDRRVIRLRMSGFSHKEIGELEGFTQQRSFQIETRAHRALRELLVEAPL